MREPRERWFHAVLVLAGLVLLLRLGTAPLFDPDEARFARTSVEMARSGDLVVPTFQGSPRLQKPPLLHWIQAALFATFGPSETLARLPAAVATLASLVLVGVAARRRFGPEAAAWAAAALGSMPVVVLLGRAGTTDALLAAHVLAAVVLDLAPPGEATRGRAVLFGALLGMAFLAKGPVGLLLPMVIVLAGRTAAAREVWPGLRAVAAAAAAAAAVIAPWALALLERVGWHTVRGILETELGSRIAEGAGHPAPVWYYAAVFPVVTLPWGFAVAVAVGRAAARFRDPETSTARYAAAGLLAGIVLLSLSRGKLGSYLLPLLPLAALLVSHEIGHSLRRGLDRTVAPLLVAASLAVEAAVVGVAAPSRIATGAPWLPWTIAGILAVGAGVSTLGWLRRRPRVAWAAAAVAQGGVLALAVWFPPTDLTERRSTAALVRSSPELRSPRALVVAVDPLPSLSYYADRIPEIVSRKEIPARLAADDDPVWVFEQDDWSALEPGERGRFRVVRRTGHFLVAERADGGIDRRN